MKMTGREQAAVWATLIGGIGMIVLWGVTDVWVWTRWLDDERSVPLDGWRRVGSFVLWNSIALALGLVAFLGARFAPGRPRAVVLAAIVPFELLVLLFRLGSLFPPDGFTFFNLFTMALVAGAAIGGVRLARVRRDGDRSAARGRDLATAG